MSNLRNVVLQIVWPSFHLGEESEEAYESCQTDYLQTMRFGIYFGDKYENSLWTLTVILQVIIWPGFGKSHKLLEKLQNRQCKWGWIWGWYGTHLKIDCNIGTNVIESTFQKVVNPTKWGLALSKCQNLTEYIFKGCQSDKIRLILI